MSICEKLLPKIRDFGRYKQLFNSNLPQILAALNYNEFIQFMASTANLRLQNWRFFLEVVHFLFEGLNSSSFEINMEVKVNKQEMIKHLVAEEDKKFVSAQELLIDSTYPCSRSTSRISKTTRKISLAWAKRTSIT
jgi:hypothetical protein